MQTEGVGPNDPITPPLAVRVREACRLTGIGRSKFYELIATGDIEVIKVGTMTLVPMASLTRFIQRQSCPTAYCNVEHMRPNAPVRAVRPRPDELT
jgi:excisionase family DNA binding protein